MLNVKVWAMSSGCWTAISFTICVLGGVIAPGLPIPHGTLELLLPGFTWISPGSFVLGLVETSLYGVYTGWLFAMLHNVFARRWGTTSQAATATKAA
ncbi:MAG: hypothetical protein A3H97_03470 [Acidobacteria bacterium RIFCSPLOWO2_02_FULL_65_29]|nr:MAG: hypothetical protein A3H97_03470 [Acidobacteria bacterium RIFCSPLOWO2_02_FULL_65_29]